MNFNKRQMNYKGVENGARAGTCGIKPDCMVSCMSTCSINCARLCKTGLGWMAFNTIEDNEIF